MVQMARVGHRRAQNRHRIAAVVSLEVGAVPRSKHLRDRTSRANCSSVHRTSGRLEYALYGRLSDVLSTCDDGRKRALGQRFYPNHAV